MSNEQQLAAILPALGVFWAAYDFQSESLRCNDELLDLCEHSSGESPDAKTLFALLEETDQKKIQSKLEAAGEQPFDIAFRARVGNLAAAPFRARLRVRKDGFGKLGTVEGVLWREAGGVSTSSETGEELTRQVLEIHHRVKNSFQVVSSLLQMHARDYDSIPQPMVQGIISHIRALGVMYDLLGERVKVGEAVPRIALGELLKRLSDVADSGRANTFSFESEDLRLSSREASSLCLVYIELIVNCLRFGRGETKLSVRRLSPTRVAMTIAHAVKERDGEPDFSLGKFLLESDFQSALTLTRDSNALTINIEIPISG